MADPRFVARLQQAIEGERERFARSASPEQILARLDSEREAARHTQERIDWLDRLLVTRLVQVSRGQWPIDPDGSPRLCRCTVTCRSSLW